MKEKKQKVYTFKKLNMLIPVLLVTVFMLVASTFAWFSMGGSATSSGATGQTEGSPLNASYLVYYKDGEGITQQTAFSTNAIEMHTYDSVFTKKNKNNPLVVRIVIHAPQLYNANENGTVTFVLSKATIAQAQDVESNGSRYSRYITSAVSFAVVMEDTSINPTTADDIYSNAYTTYFQQFSQTNETPVFKNNVTTQCFVKNNASGAETDKETSLTFSVSYTTSDWKVVNGDNALVFLLLINYDKTLIEDSGFAAASIQQGVDITSNVTYFENDLEKLTID